MTNDFIRFLRGFVYAFQGIALAVRQERNFRFHLCVGAAVVWAGRTFYAFTPAEWALTALCIGLVTALELLNSAVERAVDDPDTAHWLSAGAAKDLAAGGVLAGALGAAGAGIALFWRPAVLAKIPGWFCARPGRTVLFLALCCAAVWFIFRFGKSQKH